MIENSFKSYSNDQWLLCIEQTWFYITNILHALMLNWKNIDERKLNTLKNWSLKGSVKPSSLRRPHSHTISEQVVDMAW